MKTPGFTANILPFARAFYEHKAFYTAVIIPSAAKAGNGIFVQR